MLSILSAVLDCYCHYGALIQDAVASSVYACINKPIIWLASKRQLWLAQNQLYDDNLALHKTIALMQAKQQHLAAQIQENAALRDLLSASSQVGVDFTHAKVIAIPDMADRHMVVLDHGARNGVFVGQAILDAYGVFGFITSVSEETATALLANDTKSFIPVENAKGHRAVLQGGGIDNAMLLINIPHAHGFHVGDVLHTSGLDLRYVRGYPVGVIASIEDIGTDFVRIKVEPQAHLDRSRDVMLIWSKQKPAVKKALEKAIEPV